MPASGGGAQRISFGEGHHSTPVWSPRGDYIAFTGQARGNFSIGILKPDGSGERVLTEGFHNEGPTFAPNGRVLMFFRDVGQGPSELREVPPRVEQHVGERVPDLPRRPQYVQVIAVRQNGALAPEDAVHGASEPRAERLHAAGEIELACGLDDCMKVIALDRVVDEPEAAALARRSEAALQVSHQSPAAQRGHAAAHLQGDVAGEASRERSSRSVRIARIRSALASRAGAPAAPARDVAKIESQLTTASLHRGHDDS
jgi:hypothetical protein